MTSSWVLHVLLLAAFYGCATHAQESQSDAPQEPIQPSRPDVTDAAEFPPVGVLQLEYGVDLDPHAPPDGNEWRTPLSMRFSPGRRWLLHADVDAAISRRDATAWQRQSGVGDTRLGVQSVVAAGRPARPALALAYSVVLPTADSAKGLGSGRTDHRVAVLVSTQLGDADVDVNVGYLNVGVESSRDRASGAQGSVSASLDLGSRLRFIAEVAAHSQEYERPPGIYPLAALAGKVHRRMQLDVGLRMGIGAEAPGLGVFAGATVGVGGGSGSGSSPAVRSGRLPSGSGQANARSSSALR